MGGLGAILVHSLFVKLSKKTATQRVAAISL